MVNPRSIQSESVQGDDKLPFAFAFTVVTGLTTGIYVLCTNMKYHTVRKTSIFCKKNTLFICLSFGLVPSKKLIYEQNVRAL